MQTLSRADKPVLSVPSSGSGYVYPFLVCLIYGFFSNYFLLAAIAGLVLSVMVKELWRPYVPAVLLYFFVFHWAQVFTVVPYMDVLNGNLDHNGIYVDVNLNSYASQLLITVSLLQLAVMAWIIGRYLSRIKGITSFTLKRAVLQLNTKKVLIAFFVSTLVFPSLLAFTRFNPSVNQIVQSATLIRKVFLLLLIFILFMKRDKFRTLIVIILATEFLLGFTSFFSDFKEIILYVLVVYLTVNPTLKMGTVFRMLPIVALLAFFLIFWSYVKPSYREFVSGGSRQQVVVVSKEQALDYLWKRLGTFDAKAFDVGIETLLERIEAMQLYFKVRERVPALIPFEDGKNTMKSFRFVTLPRSLNPDKGILDPSRKATYYTGVPLATAEEGTSIAMGYFPDFYVDFGLYGMLLPLLLVAVFIGWASKKIIGNKKYNTLFNYGLLIGAIFSMGTFDADLTYFFGVIRNLAVLFLIGKWLFAWLNKYITS